MLRLVGKLMVLGLVVLCIDHAGAYLLKKGMDRRFRIDRPAPVLCIGNSHTVDGIDEEILEKGLGVPVAKYCYRGLNPFDRLAMLQHYVSEHPGALRLLVYDVDDHTFTWARRNSKTYINLYPYMENPYIRRHMEASASSSGEYESRRWLWMLRYTPDLRNFALGGYLHQAHPHTEVVTLGAIRHDIAVEGKEYGAIKLEEDNIRCLDQTVALARSQGATVVLLYIPVTDLWNAVVDPVMHRRAVEVLQRYAAADPGVVFVDYKKEFEHRHELYYDRTHMNQQGRVLLSTALAADLAPYLAKRGPAAGHEAPVATR